MMKPLICTLSLLSICLCGFADELSDRKSIGDNVAKLFMMEQFGELSNLSDQYLKNKERTSSGLWKLGLFYAGIDQVADNSIKDEAYWSNIEAIALRWVNSHPESPSGYLAYSQILENHGWAYRGNEYAEHVKKENWKPFYEYIDKSHQYLIKNKNIASRDPNWYELMLEIAKAESLDENNFNLLVNEGIKKFPFYYPIYFAAIDYLTPKWHGSKEKIEQFAKRAQTATAKKDKSGMYARVYWYASQSNYGNKLFTDSAVVWAHMSTSIDDVLSQYPDQWNINSFAYFSCLANDKEKTKELISRIQLPPIKSAWGNNTGNYTWCANWSVTK